jgi:hypothetical protein
MASEKRVSRRTLTRALPDTFRAFFWLPLFFCPFLLAGETNTPAVTFLANRYLLVIETSGSMQPRGEGLAQAVQGLLQSGLPAQARRDDTLGVWIFNEELYTGVLPLQRWTPETQKVVADRLVSFVRAQKLEKRSRLDKVLPALDRVVKNSPFITVILVCVGDEEVHGTPFDQRINEFFRTWRLRQQTALKPFVIALRAQAGKFVDCAINAAPWPTELPQLPNELLVGVPVVPPSQPAPQPAPAPQKQAAPTVPPLIISGKKRQPNTSVPNEAPAEAKTQTATPPATNIGLPQTSESTAAGPQESSQKIPAAPPAGIASVPEPIRDSASIPARSSPLITPAVPIPSQVPSTTTPTPALSVEKGVDAPIDLQPKRAPEAPSHVAIVQQPVTPGEPAVSSKSALAEDRPATVVKRDSSTSLVAVGTASPDKRRSFTGVLWVSLLVVLGALMAGVWIWRRRSQPANEVSLITESIDRRKPD